MQIYTNPNLKAIIAIEDKNEKKNYNLIASSIKLVNEGPKKGKLIIETESGVNLTIFMEEIK